ncbi:MAG: hypothetical protein H6978_15910 [Gammaproteobacteria bacterium]|nr:hypothetical protein [Gammaproteobacteria bacterium]
MFPIFRASAVTVVWASMLCAGIPVANAQDGSTTSVGAPVVDHSRFYGVWTIDLERSDDIDRAIERAVADAGGDLRPPPGTNRRTRGRYRGGPEDELFYDFVSYGENLTITGEGGVSFRIVYDGGFLREFSTDEFTRSQSASSGAKQDFSFAYWDGDRLLVESRPRDYGRAMETFSIEPDTGALIVEMSMQPAKFLVPVEATLIYKRSNAP